MALFVINDISASKFSINGREMFKTFTPVYLNESTISVSNIYDSTQFLFRNVNVSDVEVNSVVYANATDLVTNLVPVIFVPQGEGSFSQAQIDQNTADILALQTNKANINHNHDSLYYLKTEIDSIIASLPTGESIASGKVEFSNLIFYNATNVELFRVDCKKFLEQGTTLTFSNGLLSLKNDYNVELSNVNLNIQTLAYDDFIYAENIALDYSNLLYTNDFILIKNISNETLFLSKLNFADSRLFFDFATFKTDLTASIGTYLDWNVYEIDLTGLTTIFIESVLYRFDYRLQSAESIINKQNNLDIDGTGSKYPTVDAVNGGLDLKVNTSDLPSNLFFYPTTKPSDIPTYFKLVNDLNDPDYDNPAVDVPTGAISTTNQLVSSLASAEGILTGNPGIVNLTVVGNIKKISGTGSADFYFEAYHRDSLGVEILVGTSNNTQLVTNSTYEQFSATLLWNDGNFNDTDRVVLKFYANKIGGGSNPVYDFQFGGSSPVRAIFPVSFYLLAGDYELKANKGIANGYAPLNASTKIDSTYLPSYVDDVLEYANLGAFPITGETGKIYIALDTEKIYRWTGSVYVEISAGVTAHSQLTLDDGTNPHGTTKSDLGLSNVTNNAQWNLQGNTGTNPATDFIGTTDAQNFIIRTNNLERVNVNSNGAVLIKTPTSNAPLRFDFGNGRKISLTGSADDEHKYNGFGFSISSLIYQIFDNTYAHEFRVGTSTTTSTSLMIINGLGNVGINIRNPSDRLHVVGSARITGAIKDSSNSAGANGQILSSTVTGTAWITNTTGTVTSVALANGTTGTDINISGSPITGSGTITLNIPTASALNRGALSSADWISFNGKQDLLVSGTNIKTINSNSLLGSGNLLINSGAIVELNEGNGIGYVIAGRNSANYGNVGLGAFDLSLSTTLSTTKGATGYNSFCEGNDNTASGVYSHAEGGGNIASGTRSHAEGFGNIASNISSHVEGSNNTVSGIASHAEGESNIASSSYSHAEGQGNFARGYAEHSGGHYGTDYTPTGATTDRLVNYGNGTIVSRSDVFTIFRNGAVRFFRATLASILNPLSGMLIFDSGNNNRPTIHDGIAWRPLAYNDQFVDKEIPTGLINGSNVTFTLANTPISGSEHVYRNGILQEEGAGNDYTISGNTITYLTAPLTGDKLRVTYRK